MDSLDCTVYANVPQSESLTVDVYVGICNVKELAKTDTDVELLTGVPEIESTAVRHGSTTVNLKI